MAFYITKDCGTGWDEWGKSEQRGWGLSSSQKALACKLAKGDVMLHYVDHVNAWSGYSEVIDALTDNTVDHDNDVRMALPWIVPVRRVVYLARQQCTMTCNLVGVCDRHRQRAFSRIPDKEAELIIQAIEVAKLSAGKVEDPAFTAAWAQGAGGYYGGIRKALAKYRCEACGEYGITWAQTRLRGLLREGDEKPDPDWFLEAAHIIPREDNGPATADNLRALCRNCHHLIDRLPVNEKRAYLKSLPSSRWRQSTAP